MLFYLRLLVLLVLWILAWLAPKPCQAAEHWGEPIYAKPSYTGWWTHRLHIRGRWLAPELIANRIDESLRKINECDPPPHSYVIFRLRIRRSGEAARVWAATDQGDEVVTPFTQCATGVLSSISFPHSRGLRRVRVRLDYSSNMASISPPLRTVALTR